MLIVLRGNSGSGKSSTARLLRDAAINRGTKRKIAIIEQDYLRRFILKEKESEGSDNISLIYQTVLFALERDYDVILEGILYSPRYKKMLNMLAGHGQKTYYFYFDVGFDETLKRHAKKPNADEFGEKEMREWYKDRDVLGFKDETILTENMSQEVFVRKILEVTGL
jgi:thymidylate kinase